MTGIRLVIRGLQSGQIGLKLLKIQIFLHKIDEEKSKIGKNAREGHHCGVITAMC